MSGKIHRSTILRRLLYIRALIRRLSANYLASTKFKRRVIKVLHLVAVVLLLQLELNSAVSAGDQQPDPPNVLGPNGNDRSLLSQLSLLDALNIQKENSFHLTRTI